MLTPVCPFPKLVFPQINKLDRSIGRCSPENLRQQQLQSMSISDWIGVFFFFSGVIHQNFLLHAFSGPLKKGIHSSKKKNNDDNILQEGLITIIGGTKKLAFKPKRQCRCEEGKARGSPHGIHTRAVQNTTQGAGRRMVCYMGKQRATHRHGGSTGFWTRSKMVGRWGGVGGEGWFKGQGGRHHANLKVQPPRGGKRTSVPFRPMKKKREAFSGVSVNVPEMPSNGPTCESVCFSS